MFMLEVKHIYKEFVKKIDKNHSEKFYADCDISFNVNDGMVFGIIRMLTLIAFGYLAVTISTTVLANHKYKVFLTIAVFVGVLVLVGVLTSAATNFLMETLTDQIGLSQSLETGMTALPEESNFFDILKVIEKTKMAEAMHVGMVIDVGFSVLQWAAAYFLSVVLVKKKVSL